MTPFFFFIAVDCADATSEFIWTKLSAWAGGGIGIAGSGIGGVAGCGAAGGSSIFGVGSPPVGGGGCGSGCGGGAGVGSGIGGVGMGGV